eukprot:jgi/Botrbrau1/3206/Bobra.37_2s0036.1
MENVPRTDSQPTATDQLVRVDFVRYTAESVARGVFSERPIRKGTLIETSHCILIPKNEYQDHICHTILEHYVFSGKAGVKILALGLGSLFNHNSSPNVDYRLDQSNQLINFFAARDIACGEELCIFYGNVWFEQGEIISLGNSLSHEHMDDEVKFLASMEL